MWAWWFFSRFGSPVEPVTMCVAARQVYQSGASAAEVYQGGAVERQAGC